MPVHIACPVYENAKHRPQDVAVLWSKGDRSITWQVLSQYVSTTVRLFKEHGVRPGTRVLLAAGSNPLSVIVILSLWRLGAAVCVLDKNISDSELMAAATQLCSVLVIVENKRKIKAQQLLLEEAVALEEIKNFWCGSEEAVPQIDIQMEAVVFLDQGNVVSTNYGDLLAGPSQGAGQMLRSVLKSVKSGESLVI